MKALSLPSLILVSLPLGACADTSTVGTPGQKLEVAVAPLTLPNVADVCYGLTVYNGDPALLDDAVAGNDPDTVWSESGVCSTQFGNDGGGDVTYIGPCDASVTGNNFVALVLETVQTTDGNTLDDQISSSGPRGDRDADFENPCPWTTPCTLDFECEENADVLVEFNLTIMRDAEQGFFDVAVNFEDIFCSGKFDSCYDVTANSGRPIELLFGDDDDRDHTAVAALACTAGPGSAGTELLLTTPTVTCQGSNGPVEFGLDLAAPNGGDLGGNHEVAASSGGSYTLGYALYFGNEELDCGTAVAPVSCEKVYYNLALNLGDLAAQGLADCRFKMGATAVEVGDTTFDATGSFADPQGVYPGIGYGQPGGIVLTGPKDGQGVVASLCTANPLNGEGSLVQTAYIKGAGFGPDLAGSVDFRSNGGPAQAFAPPADTAVAFILTGTISSSNGVGGIIVGDPFVATLAFDSAQVPDYVEGETRADYTAYSLTWVIGSQTFYEDPDSWLTVWNEGWGDKVGTNGTGLDYAGLSLMWDTTVFSSADLPTALSMSGLVSGDSYVVLGGGGLFGRITDITVAP